MSPPPASGTTNNLIVFLCPNGHKLNSPASLQGKAGQCPHCGAKFIVPSYDDHDDDALEIVEDDPRASDSQRVRGSSRVQDSDDVIDIDLDDQSESIQPAAQSRLGGQHPMAMAFARLWDQRSAGRQVELFTTDGASVICERFRAISVHEDAGVFAARDDAGSMAVVIVAWNAVARIALRGMRELPRGMFD